MPSAPLVRTGLAVGLALGGVVVAPLAALVSRLEWRPGGLVLPWGLALALAGSVGLVRVARAVSYRHGVVAAGGWLVALTAMLLGPHGDVVLSGDVLGYAFLLLGSAAVIIAGASGGGRP